jgi:hypothetical protein
MATARQNWALFCGTKLDVRNVNLTVDQASDLIGRMKSGEDITDELVQLGAKGTAKKPSENVDFQAVYNEARQAGMEAGNSKVPVPMIVCEHSNPLDDNSPISREYAPVMGGVCGFAWVKFPGNTAWGKWTKKQGYAHSSYPTGLQIWVSEFGQSMEKKEAYAYAFAEVLRKHGIKAYAGSRMD